MTSEYEDFQALAMAKNKPKQSQFIPKETKPIYRPLAGNPKHETRNPKRVEWVLFEKTKPILAKIGVCSFAISIYDIFGSDGQVFSRVQWE